MKLTKRKGFNFFRSYFDVYNELRDNDKVMFIDALLERQFLGVKPKNLTGMAKFAYISQTNSIDSQVKGFEDKTGIILTPTEPPTDGGSLPPRQQVEGKEEVQVEGKGKDSEVLPFVSEEFAFAWNAWVEYKKEKKEKLTQSTKIMQLRKLGAWPEHEAIGSIGQSIQNGWKGLFEFKDKPNGITKNRRESPEELAEAWAKRVKQDFDSGVLSGNQPPTS